MFDDRLANVVGQFEAVSVFVQLVGFNETSSQAACSIGKSNRLVGNFACVWVNAIIDLKFCRKLIFLDLDMFFNDLMLPVDAVILYVLLKSMFVFHIQFKCLDMHKKRPEVKNRASFGL